MNVQVEVTWQTLQTIAHSVMVNIQVSDKYINFALMYMTDNIFPVIPIKHSVNQDGEPTMPHKLETCTKPSISNLHILFCTCIAQNSTACVDTKLLNISHQSQKVFRVIFVGTPQHQKGYIIYVPSTRKIVSSHDVVFEEILSSVLAYTSRTYSEALNIQPEVPYISYAT